MTVLVARTAAGHLSLTVLDRLAYECELKDEVHGAGGAIA
jgi:hypothetical protein